MTYQSVALVTKDIFYMLIDIALKNTFLLSFILNRNHDSQLLDTKIFGYCYCADGSGFINYVSWELCHTHE